MAWENEARKLKAKRADLSGFLTENHPDLINQRTSGQYEYTERTCITFFRGRDGEFRYCDQEKRKLQEDSYFGDSIKFLVDFVGGYTFTSAVQALCDYDDTH